MATQVTFETSTLADVVARAARISPNKGEAFDKAEGILLEVDPASGTCIIRATDLLINLRIVVSAMEIKGERAVWRLPSPMFSNVLAGFPSGNGQKVDLADKGGFIHLRSPGHRMTGKLRYGNEGDFPRFEPFDPDGMDIVPRFAKRLSQVAWACGAGGVLDGVHIDGGYLVGCDRANAAIVECPVPVAEPITAPLAPVRALIKDLEDVRVRATERQLHVMPDAWTQITTVLFADPYPSVPLVLASLQPYEDVLTVDRDRFVNALQSMLVLVRGERYPRCSVIVNPGELKIVMKLDDTGETLNDVLDIEGGLEGYQVDFTPTALLHALEGTNAQRVEFGYHQTQLNKQPRSVVISDKDEYRAVLSPRTRS